MTVPGHNQVYRPWTSEARSVWTGSSTAFGVGATSDSMTVPSLMFAKDKTQWRNMAGRAHNSTQELFNFILHIPAKVDRVYIMSGVNNLVLYYLGRNYDAIHGSFFFSNQYHDSMTAQAISWKRKLLNLVRPKKNEGNKPQKSKFDILTVLDRDLGVWKMLSESMGFGLVYIFQPVAPWCKTIREHSIEERTLFQGLDTAGGKAWSAIKGKLNIENYWFLSHGLYEICSKHGIDFIDMNREINPNGWLFVDRVHMTDLGYQRVAEVLWKLGLG